jgi:hypothetical protein
MDCMQSFNVTINQTGTFTNPDVKTWTTTNRNWVYNSSSDFSTFLIEGFKTVDLYGVSLSGYVASHKAATSGQVIVNDWDFEISLVAINAVVSGRVAPSPAADFWGLNYNNTNSRILTLGKYNRSIDFKSPFSGLSQINFIGLQANGYNAQTDDTASLDYNLVFTFYYKNDGE